MLIIKKFHDYYDTALGSGGVDKKRVYQRTTKLHELVKIDKFDNIPFVANLDYYWPYNDFTLYIVGFCGKSYVLFYEEVPLEYDDEVKKKYFYGNEIFERATFKRKESEAEVKTFLDKYHNKPNFSELFIKYNTPVFIIKNITQNIFARNMDKTCDIVNIEVNPILKDIQFVRMFNPFQTFQEIEMFIGGVLGNTEKEIDIVDEKYRKSQRGMNEWSFRNPDPPKRKQKPKT